MGWSRWSKNTGRGCYTCPRIPLYSPDFSLIEWAFSKLKTRRCKAQARTRDVRKEAICTAAEWISEHDAENRFDHCGNHVH